jgi:hypothetical protein
MYQRILFGFVAFVFLFGAYDRAYPADVYSTKDGGVVLTEVVSNPFAGVYGGVNGGGQFTSIAISADPYDEAFDGLSNDGFVGGGHLGFNACVGRICFGPYFEGGWSNGETTFADIDVLKFKSYRQVALVVGSQVGRETFVSVHGGYEWQDWEAGAAELGGVLDVEVGMWALGAGIETMVVSNVSFGVKFDYLVLDTAEVDGLGDIGGYLDDTEALRIQAKLSYRPSVKLPSLESLRF